MIIDNFVLFSNIIFDESFQKTDLESKNDTADFVKRIYFDENTATTATTRKNKKKLWLRIKLAETEKKLNGLLENVN